MRWPLALLLAMVPAVALASPQAALAAALADAEQLGPGAACRTRYIDGSLDPQARRKVLTQLRKGWANSLSREADFGELRDVGGGVYAVLLDEFRWSADVWETQEVEPYFHEWVWYPQHQRYYLRHGRWLDQASICRLAKLTRSFVPLVRADWWLFYSSRNIDLNNKDIGFAYYEWLGIKDQKAFEALRFLDKKKAIIIGDELRAALEEGRSRVSQKDRQIEWFSTYGDSEQGFWITRDADDTSEGNTAVGNLDGKGFKEAAREAYTGLPNRLWAFLAADAKGKRQATVPDKIAADSSPHHQGRDRRIGPQSCLHCHVNGGLQDVDDWARRTLKAPNRLDTFKIEDLLRLKRQYFRSLDAQLAKGRRAYTEALHQCCGLTPQAFARIHAQEYYAYLLTPRDPTRLALEMGVSEECLVRALKRFFDPANIPAAKDKKRLAALESLLIRPPDGIPVSYVEQFFSSLHEIVREYGKP